MPSSNKVTLVGSTISTVTFIKNSIVVTEGAAHDSAPSITSEPNSSFTIELKADRKKSEATAEAFVAKTGGAGHVAAKGGGKTPKELNFFFGVVISVTTSAGTVPITVYLAQGHHGLTNNWWIGANTFLEPPQVLLAISDNRIQSELKVKLDVHEFTFTV